MTEQKNGQKVWYKNPIFLGGLFVVMLVLVGVFVIKPMVNSNNSDTSNSSGTQPTGSGDSTETSTDDSTETPTDDSTDDSTETPTEDSTETPTEDSTEGSTEDSTEDNSETQENVAIHFGTTSSAEVVSKSISIPGVMSVPSTVSASEGNLPTQSMMTGNGGNSWPDTFTTTIREAGTSESVVEFKRVDQNAGWGAYGIVAPVSIKVPPGKEVYSNENGVHKFRFVKSESGDDVGYGFWKTNKNKGVHFHTVNKAYLLVLQEDGNLVIYSDSGPVWALGVNVPHVSEKYIFFINSNHNPVVSHVLEDRLNSDKRLEYELTNQDGVKGVDGGWVEFSNENGFALMDADGNVIHHYWKP